MSSSRSPISPTTLSSTCVAISATTPFRLLLNCVDDLRLRAAARRRRHFLLNLLDDTGLDLLLDRVDDLRLEVLLDDFLDGLRDVLLDLLRGLSVEEIVERRVEELRGRGQAERHGAEKREHARPPPRPYVKARAAARTAGQTAFRHRYRPSIAHAHDEMTVDSH
jgi:hypothetical protein